MAGHLFRWWASGSLSIVPRVGGKIKHNYETLAKTAEAVDRLVTRSARRVSSLFPGSTPRTPVGAKTRAVEELEEEEAP